MLRRTLYAVITALLLSFLAPQPARAHYDDVHYALNYYIARVIGYTPAQAHRMASLCFWIDYAPETEPTQIDNGVAQLFNSVPVTAEALGRALYRVISATAAASLEGLSIDQMTRAVVDNLNKLPGDVEVLAKREDLRDVFEAQWRFHAFRDLYRFPDSAVDGPDAAKADAAIIAQQDLLFKEAFDLKNLGAFLHFFQDEVPHSGYVIGGGHWVLPPGRKVIGGTTDWLSHYPQAVNERTVLDTARYMLAFMDRASKGKQKPLVSTPEAVLARVRSAIEGLRSENPAPTPLPDIIEVIRSKMLAAKHGKGQKGSEADEAKYAKHSDGPDLKKAYAVLNASMRADGMVEAVVPEYPIKLTPAKSTVTSGAYVPQRDESMMYGDLNVAILDPTPNRPSRIEIDVVSVPSQRGEKPALIGVGEIAAVSPAELSGKSNVLITDVPAGDVKLEVRYYDRAKKQVRAFSKLARIERAVTNVVLNPEAQSGKYVLVKTEVNTESGKKIVFNGIESGTPTYGPTTYTLELSTKKPDGTLDRDFHVNWTFSAPPSELLPGQTYMLTAQGTGSSANKTVQTAGIGIAASGVLWDRLTKAEEGFVGFVGGNAPYMSSGKNETKITGPLQPGRTGKAVIRYTPNCNFLYDWVWDKPEELTTASLRGSSPNFGKMGTFGSTGAFAKTNSAGAAPGGGAPGTTGTSTKPTNPPVGPGAGKEGVKGGNTGAAGTKGGSDELRFETRDAELTVRSAPATGPNSLGGLKAGDQVIAADGKRLRGMSAPEAVKAITAAKQLTVSRGDQLLTLETQPSRPGGNTGTTAGKEPGGAIAGGKLINGWRAKTAGSATAEADEDQGVKLSVPANAAGQYSAWSEAPLLGDFDIAVIYILDEWEEAKDNALSVEFRISASPDEKSAPIARGGRTVKPGSPDTQFAQIGASQKSVPYDASLGQLRIQRRGDTIRIFKDNENSDEWTELVSARTEGLPKALYLGAVVRKSGGSSLVLKLDSASNAGP